MSPQIAPPGPTFGDCPTCSTPVAAYAEVDTVLVFNFGKPVSVHIGWDLDPCRHIVPTTWQPHLVYPGRDLRALAEEIGGGR